MNFDETVGFLKHTQSGDADSLASGEPSQGFYRGAAGRRNHLAALE
jgi:hypothetical protein